MWKRKAGEVMEKISPAQKIALISVALVSVFLVVLIWYSFIESLLLGRQSADHEKRNEILKNDNMALRATSGIQSKQIKNMNETLIQLTDENDMLESKERKLNVNIEYQAQQIKNMSEILTRLSARNKKLKNRGIKLNATSEFQAQQIKNISETLSRLFAKNKLVTSESMALKATTGLQSQQIKNMNENLMQLTNESKTLKNKEMMTNQTLMLLTNENKKLKDHEIKLKATTDFQAQQIKSMSKILTRLSEKTAAIPMGVYKSCKESEKNKNGINYIIKRGMWYKVYCDMTTDGGGWTVFQRRLDGSVDFYRTWKEYAQGFGNLNGEFWLGLEVMHQLLLDGNYELRVDITDWKGNSAYAKYGKFSIFDKLLDYMLSIGHYSGTAGNGLSKNDIHPFGAKDKDTPGDCAQKSRSAWWFDSCFNSTLNGMYNGTSGSSSSGITWLQWEKTYNSSIKTTEMKFREKID